MSRFSIWTAIATLALAACGGESETGETGGGSATGGTGGNTMSPCEALCRKFFDEGCATEGDITECIDALCEEVIEAGECSDELDELLQCMVDRGEKCSDEVSAACESEDRAHQLCGAPGTCGMGIGLTSEGKCEFSATCPDTVYGVVCTGTECDCSVNGVSVGTCHETSCAEPDSPCCDMDEGCCVAIFRAGK